MNFEKVWWAGMALGALAIAIAVGVSWVLERALS